MKNKTNIFIGIIIIILLIVIGVLYFSETKPLIKSSALEVTGPDYLFVGDSGNFNVNTNSENTIVIYKNGYLYSDRMSYIGTNPQIPFIAKKAGNEEAEFRAGEASQKLNVLICNKINAKSKTISIMVDSNYKFNFNISGECLSKYSFNIEDSNIASYSNGTIVGRKVGTTTFTIFRDSETYTYKIQIKPKELKFTSTLSSINVGSSSKLSLSGVDGTLTCKSSNEKVLTAEVNGENCLIKGVGPGEAKLTASSGGRSTEINIKIIQPVTAVSFKEKSYSVAQGSKVNAEVIISPSNATTKTFTCSSGNTSIATVSASGSNCVIKGVKIGSTKINVDASGKKTSVTVKVTDPVKIVNVRVASWNLARYAKPSVAVKKQAEFFKSYNIDIGGFQEVKNWDGSMTVPLNVYKSVTGYNYVYYDLPAGNAIISKYTIKSSNKNALSSCRESRGLLKAIVNINGIDISIYDTHFSYQSECFTTHTDSFAKIVKNDPNPQIIMGDFNGAGKNLVSNLGSGYEMIGRDTIRNIYADMVVIKAKDANGKIRLKGNGFEAVKTAGTYTDHNMVIANIQVLN